MTRPTILDLDMAVAPRKSVPLPYDLQDDFCDDPSCEHGCAEMRQERDEFNRKHNGPDPAWDDVRKYVDGLEERLVAVSGPCSLGCGCEQYGVCYADAHGKPEECGKPSFECEALKDARRIADHDKKLWLAAEAKIEILIAENARLQSELEETAGLEKAAQEELSAAEARIAELEKRLADAERVIEPFARLGTMSTHIVNEDGTASFSFFRTADMNAFTDARRAARAYMEGK